jgi:hypothetical protein
MRKEYFFVTLLNVLMLLLIVGLVAFYVTLLVMYGGKPHDEIPTWVLWFLFRRR